MSWDPHINRKPTDWTGVFFWGAILASVLLITGTSAWNFGRNIQEASWMHNYGVQTCLQLHKPLGQVEAKAPPGAKAQCTSIVDMHHEHCIDELKNARSRRTRQQRRRDYVTCLMASPGPKTLDASAQAASSK